MIRIEKPVAPEILSARGSRKTRQDCRAYDSGSREFGFQRQIYASPAVRECLLEVQHNKCCYCESLFEGTSYAQVEHFRPKASVRQSKKSFRKSPGYYWLAYEWSNLFVSCQKCNTLKSDLFPLADSRRARSHRDDTQAERALLVDPGREDPRKHIRFRGDAVQHLTAAGGKSIEVFGLRRAALFEDRKRRLDSIRTLCRIVEYEASHDDPKLSSLAEEAKARILASMQADSEFSSMICDFANRAGLTFVKLATGHAEVSSL